MLLLFVCWVGGGWQDTELSFTLLMKKLYYYFVSMLLNKQTEPCKSHIWLVDCILASTDNWNFKSKMLSNKHYWTVDKCFFSDCHSYTIRGLIQNRLYGPFYWSHFNFNYFPAAFPNNQKSKVLYMPELQQKKDFVMEHNMAYFEKFSLVWTQ